MIHDVVLRFGDLGAAAQRQVHSVAHESGDGSGVSLKVTGEASVAADPGEGAFDDPTRAQGERRGVCRRASRS